MGDVQADFSETAARIAGIPCNDSTHEVVLRELSRWNNPGKTFLTGGSRFVATNLALPRPSWSNHPTRVLFRTIKAMIGGSDKVYITKAHWNEVQIDPRWCSVPSTRLLSGSDTSQKPPLFEGLKRCGVGSERIKVGTAFSGHAAVHDTVNKILSVFAASATRDEVERFIGKSGLVRPVAQHSIKWHSLTTPTARRVAVWTLAVSCSLWGLEFVPSFLQFCTAALVEPICGVTREECKEGFAACVAVATIARARSGGLITEQEMASCTGVLWILDVIERACGTAQGTLWASRHITKVTGPRICVKACNKWESPIQDNLKPSNVFFVTGTNCAHAQKENEDGTYGEECAGRWVVVTKLEELEQQGRQDQTMMVTLTHGNVPAAYNVLALLERKGQWAYVQGKDECLTCAYKRALTHGFPVVVDSPQNSTTVVVGNHPTEPMLGGKTHSWILLIFVVLMFIIPHVDAQITAAQYPLEPSVFKPNATCEHFFGPPVRSVIAWKSLVSIIRAFQSVLLTLGAIRSGKRFVRRTPFNLVTSIVSTLIAGLSGWITTRGCAEFKSVALMKGLVTASVNRLAYEAIDIVGMIISIAGVAFTLVDVNVHQNPWALLQPEQLTMICLSVSYLWRWFDTSMKQSTSNGVVGSSIPLFTSHVVALALAVITFVFNTKKDTKSAVASYVSDSLLMSEVMMQFFLLV